MLESRRLLAITVNFAAEGQVNLDDQPDVKVEMAGAAVAKNLGEPTIAVDPANPKNIFVASLPRCRVRDTFGGQF